MWSPNDDPEELGCAEDAPPAARRAYLDKQSRIAAERTTPSSVEGPHGPATSQHEFLGSAEAASSAIETSPGISPARVTV